MHTPSPFLRAGLIGCGKISNAYFHGLAQFKDLVQITACADLDLARAQAKADEHGVSKACSVEQLLADPDIDLVINLTVPQSHAPINLAALRAGKHAYCEKPFSLNVEEGREVVEEAKKRGLRVGTAPDTVLGGGIQTCRKLIVDGVIGTPVAFTANMLCHGHESWHPSPEFYYQVGGGPLFDMGPYYLTSLVMMLGPVESVAAQAGITFPERTITSQPLAGKVVPVETPTHIVGALKFKNGAIGNITMSFDVWAHHLPRLQVYGSEGSLDCPDPNTFGGEISLWTTSQREWTKVPHTHDPGTGRGIGIAEMADAIRAERLHRLNDAMGVHIVEIMQSFLDSAQSGKTITLQTTFEGCPPLPAGIPISGF